MVPQDVMRQVYERLEAADRMALDFALPDPDKMATDTDRRLAMLDYADRNGMLKDPAKDVLGLLQHNLGHPTADRLLEKYANVALKICRLEQAMATGVYGPIGDYPTPAECNVFEVWYGLCMTVGTLSPDQFDAFMSQEELVSMVLVGPSWKQYTAMLKSCDPVLLEHILFENIFIDGHIHARNNARYLMPQTVRLFLERGLGPERWARYLEDALSAGAMDIAEMVMAEGYRLDGTKVPARHDPEMPQLRVKTAKTVTTEKTAKRPDQCERCFTSMYIVALIAALVYVARILFEA